MRPNTVVLTLAVLTVAAASGSASAQARLYHLRPGSTLQQGCFIGCDCVTFFQEPLRGHFRLTPTAPDPVYQNHAISDASFHSLGILSETFSGTGTFQIGGDPGANQRMRLDLTIVGNPPAQHWDSGVATSTSRFPAINDTVTINNYQCYDVVLTIRASPLRSDWNTDGEVTVQDIFDFVNTWLAGDGDADDNGQTTVMDLFTFINDWFAGI